MNRYRRIMILTVILIIGAAVTGAFAYFHVETTFVNLFKVILNDPEDSMIQVTLTEPDWEKTGKTMAQKALPGMKIPKDPTITNYEDPVYARYAIAITDNDGIVAIKDDEKYIVKEIMELTDVETAEVRLDESDIEEGVVYYEVQKILDKDGLIPDSRKNHTLFTKINIPKGWKQSDLDRFGNFHIKILVQAVDIGAKDKNGQYAGATQRLKEAALVNPFQNAK